MCPGFSRSTGRSAQFPPTDSLVSITEQFFAPCPRGLETVLVSELEALGADEVTAVKGGVQFSGRYSICYTINLESRIASRVLWRVGHGRYSSEQDVYEAACGLSWCDWFDVRFDQNLLQTRAFLVRGPQGFDNASDVQGFSALFARP